MKADWAEFPGRSAPSWLRLVQSTHLHFKSPSLHPNVTAIPPFHGLFAGFSGDERAVAVSETCQYNEVPAE
jgi:hypothetical protein